GPATPLAPDRRRRVGRRRGRAARDALLPLRGMHRRPSAHPALGKPAGGTGDAPGRRGDHRSGVVASLAGADTGPGGGSGDVRRPTAGGVGPAARGAAPRPATIREPVGGGRRGRGRALHGPLSPERNDAMKRFFCVLLVLVLVALTSRVSGQTQRPDDSTQRPVSGQKLPDDEATATALEDIEILGRLLERSIGKAYGLPVTKSSDPRVGTAFWEFSRAYPYAGSQHGIVEGHPPLHPEG